jgi:hypothetical protein
MKEYRQNSHSFSLAFWALLCTATAIVLFVHSHKIVSRVLRTEEILAGIALLIFGPAAFAIYLIRARRVWVSVDQLRGVVVSGRRTIVWDDIYKVERRRPALRKTAGPAEVPAFNAGSLDPGGGCLDPGCGTTVGEFFLGALILIAALFALWVICFVFVPLVVLPVLEVFAPFGDRIKIHTRRGTLVLRDLRDADEFMRLVALRRPVTER